MHACFSISRLILILLNVSLLDLKVSLSKLSDKNLYIEGTIWYQPSLFAIIDQNLGVIDDWLKELDDFFEFSYGTTVHSVLKENENRSYGLIAWSL